MMNIHAKKGAKVIVTMRTKDNGYEPDREKVNNFLEIDKPYTIGKIEISGWHTDVYIQEVPNIAFNSVNFEDVNTSDKNVS